ncbi:MAG: SRPBCC family protein [Bacteroidota bacterium]
MSILITIISVIAILIFLVLVIALFLKKEYTIERDIVIDKPGQQVFNYIKFIKNQDAYSVWNQIDPAMQKTYTGTDGTVGFVYAWDSTNKKAGKGEQEIISIKEDERVDMALHFIRPFEGRSIAYMATTQAAGSQTKVKWGINGKMNYPMNFMMLFMNMENMLGKDLADGLANLKRILEK